MAVRDVVQAAAGQGGGANLYVEDVFSTYLYTGNATSQTITNGIDLDGEGGLVWIKDRTAAISNHLYDTARGVNNRLTSDSTGAQYNGPSNYGVTSFNSNGFSLADHSSTNNSGDAFASWTFRKAPKFFDVVTYTGDGVNGRTISHSLGSTPGFVIVKRTNTTGDWAVYHRGLTSAGYYVQLNNTNAQSAASSIWASTAPTDAVFTVGSASVVNAAGSTYVAYLFAHDAGGFGDDGLQNVISCGSYTGNGSTTGPVINLGWEPQLVLIKSASIAGNWWIVDSMRKMSLSDFSNGIKPNSSAVEDMYFYLYPNATGFSPASTSDEINQSGATYIYMAIRRPMKSFDSGTDVFAIDYQGTGGVVPGYKAPFPVDMGIWKDRDGGGTQITSRLLADGLLDGTNTNAESKPSRSYSFDYQNGWFDSSTPDTTRVGWMFRRAPGFMDVVAYTGTGANRTVAHNLGVAPEMIVLKHRNGADNWVVGHKQFNWLGPVYLNESYGYIGDNIAWWNNTAPTTTEFTIGYSAASNTNTGTYVAYLFASLPGVSKVGSYSGTGGNVNVDCGFSAGARFVLIKRTDASGDWYVWDSVRGIVAGNDPYLLLNSTAAEVTSTDYIDPLASGFTVTSSAPAALNASGGTYIFLAIA